MSFIGSFFELIRMWLIGIGPVVILAALGIIGSIIRETRRDSSRPRKELIMNKIYVKEQLVKELCCPIFLMFFDDPTHWWGQVKDCDIKFSVYIKDTHFQVVIEENGTEKSFPETDKPEKVIQAAKEFKSEYL